MKNFKYVFRKIRGRIVPVKVSKIGEPDDLQKITHIKKARKAVKELTKESKSYDKKFKGLFYKISKQQSKETGSDIARRIAKLKKLRGK